MRLKIEFDSYAASIYKLNYRIKEQLNTLSSILFGRNVDWIAVDIRTYEAIHIQKQSQTHKSTSISRLLSNTNRKLFPNKIENGESEHIRSKEIEQFIQSTWIFNVVSVRLFVYQFEEKVWWNIFDFRFYVIFALRSL